MASTKIKNESKENINHQDLEVYSKLEVILKARNKIISRRDTQLPCSITEDTDLSDVLDDDKNLSVRTNKYLQDNEQKLIEFNEKIRNLKRTSGNMEYKSYLIGIFNL